MTLAQRQRPKLTVIIPCFNERRTILEIIRRVNALPVPKEVIVVDNCSTDGTRDLLLGCRTGSGPLPERSDVPGLLPTIPGQRIVAAAGFALVLQPRNFQKGMSVRTGIALAEGEYVVCQDADLSITRPDLLRLLEHAERTGAAAVFGSRLAGARHAPVDAFQFGRVALTRLFRLLYGGEVTDVATCYKLMRTAVARSLELKTSGFDLDFEIPARLRRRRYRIEDVSISYSPRTRAEGKKIRWRDGLSAAWTMLECRVA